MVGAVVNSNGGFGKPQGRKGVNNRIFVNNKKYGNTRIERSNNFRMERGGRKEGNKGTLHALSGGYRVF